MTLSWLVLSREGQVHLCGLCLMVRYAAMMQGVCSLSLFVSIAPFLALQAMCTWTLLYWVYKAALLRLAKRPSPEMTGVVHQVSFSVSGGVL